MSAMSKHGATLYVEPVSEYFSRKYFHVVLVSLTPAWLLAADVVWFWGPDWSIALVAHIVIIGGSALLLFMDRKTWRYQRFRIFDDGFWLPGSRAGPDGLRFVPFEQISSVEADATPVKGGMLLVGIAARLRPDGRGGEALRGPPSEVLISSTALG